MRAAAEPGGEGLERGPHGERLSSSAADTARTEQPR
jgi:hypothetical protein